MNFLNYVGYLSIVLVLLQILNETINLLGPFVSICSRKYFTWREMDKQIKKLSKKIKNDNINYAMICGTGRGGSILASMLSYQLDLTPVLAFDRKYIINSEDSTLDSKCIIEKFILQKDYENIKSKRILLITPQSDPGVTLNHFKEVLKASGFSGKIDKCAIVKSSRTRDTDLRYYLYSYDPTRKKCKKFPWEKNNPDLMKKIEEE